MICYLFIVLEIISEHALIKKYNRILSIDIFRLIAIFAVIIIHVSPFSPAHNDSLTWESLNVFFVGFSRFAVPFFFIISGYLFAIKLEDSGSKLKPALVSSRRVFVLFLFWSAVYLIPFRPQVYLDLGLLAPIKEAYWGVLRIIDYPLPFIFQGTKVHLWFLVSLIWAFLITALFCKKKLFLWGLAIGLYIIGVLYGAYRDVLDLHISLPTRFGPLFSLLPFVIGISLYKLSPQPSWLWRGFLLFIVAAIFHFVETNYVLENSSGVVELDYAFSTVFMGLGVALMALSDHRYIQSQRLSAIGKITLGVYAGHFIFVDLLSFFDTRIVHPVWEVFSSILVLIFSIALTKILSSFKATQRFVL